MEESLKVILDEFDQLKGQFIISPTNTVERLISIGGDEDDWYYITYNGKEIKWYSCLLRIIPLKNKINNEDYDELIRIAKLNHQDQASQKDFLIYINKYVSEINNTNKLLTEFCWNIN